jgi:hypothetical protein
MLVFLAAIPMAMAIGAVGVPLAHKFGTILRMAPKQVKACGDAREAGGQAMANAFGQEILVVEKVYAFDNKEMCLYPSEISLLNALDPVSYQGMDTVQFLARIWAEQPARRAAMAA